MSIKPLLPTLALLSLVACSATTATPAAAPGPQRDAGAGEIMFQQDGRGRIEVAIIGADGSGLVAPFRTLPGGHQSNPDWDPTGDRVVFAMVDGETEDLWVGDADGRNARRLVDCVDPCLYLDDPDWSPDGRSIVVSRTVLKGTKGVSTLETVDVATGDTTVVLGPMVRTFTAGARWSPDGRRVVFEYVHKTGRRPDSEVDAVTLSIVQMSGEDHPVRGITDPALFAATADWSPDGKLIVYSALPTAQSEANDLFTVRPRGGTPTRLTRLARTGGFAVEPGFDPDGSRVVFSGRETPGDGLLLSVPTTGGRVREAIPGVQVLGRHPRVRP